jgi:hypothetical protein
LKLSLAFSHVLLTTTELRRRWLTSFAVFASSTGNGYYLPLALTVGGGGELSSASKSVYVLLRILMISALFLQRFIIRSSLIAIRI